MPTGNWHSVEINDALAALQEYKVPLAAAFAKGLTFKIGQMHVHHYLAPLLNCIQKGDIDPSFIITRHLSLEDASHGYDIFKI